MVFMPPRHGKSELASRRFPAWYLGSRPANQIIAASYNSELASDFGRDVRNIVASREYRNIFDDVSLAEDSQAANRWHTSAGGSYVAAGVGTAITGRGAHVLLVDDPIKDREEADSPLTRQRVWDWYTSTAYTRLMPGGAIVLIQTRWHEDDLAGRLLNAQKRFGGDTWVVLELKAIDEHGAPLWPQWYSLSDLERIRSVIGPRDWAALYQQTPVPDGKSEFRGEWLRWWSPDDGDGMNKYVICDPAGEKKKTSDRTAIWVIGLNTDRNYYVLDFVYDRLNLTERANEIIRLHRVWKPKRVGYEKYGKDSDIEAIKIVQNAQNYRFDIVPLSGQLKKEDRIRRLVPLFESGRVYMPASLHRTCHDGIMTDLIEQFRVEEYDRFPVGAHDDGLDCMARITDPDLNAIFPMVMEDPTEHRYNRRRGRSSLGWAA